MRKKTVLKTLAALLIVGAGGGILVAQGAAEKVASPSVSTASVPTMAVKMARFERAVTSVGELKAARSSIINSPFEGKVVKVVPEGTRVAEGDPVVWMDTADLEDKLKEEEAQLALAQKDLESAKEEYRLQELKNEYDMQAERAKVELAEQRKLDAEQKYEAERVLVERNISARTKLEAAELARLQAAVELRQAQINLKKTEENLASNMRVRQTAIDKATLELERIQRNIDDYEKRITEATLRAPVMGEVSYFRIWKNGSMGKVMEGDQVWPRVNIAEIPDRSVMTAVVPVNELDVASVEVGQPAIVQLDALPGRSFSGVVERKSIVAIDNSQNPRRGGQQAQGAGPREYEVGVRLNEQDDAFFQGMTASVRIITAQMDNALQVPLEAVTLQDDKLGVFREDGTGATFVPLNVAQINDQFAAVEGSLKAGDRVFLRNPRVSADEARSLGFEALRRIQRAINGETPGETPAAATAAGNNPKPAANEAGGG